MKQYLNIFFYASMLIFILVGCETIVPAFKSGKIPTTTRTSAAIAADKYFWQNFHTGNYAKIPEILRRLQAAYLENPNDVLNVAHIGFTHAWAGSERIRLAVISPSVIDHYALAVKYFAEAEELDPDDVRLLGFHGDFLMAQASLAQNQQQVTEGYFKVKQAISVWPEWGNFTLSYVLSLQPANSELFQEAITLMWENLDVCALETVNRANPDYSQYYKLLRTKLSEHNRRACWNTWIAPHNLEGFFVHFGDILVKAGDWKLGLKMYNNAKTSPEYASFPYKNMLEQRIQHAQQNVVAFNNYIQTTPSDNDKVLMIDSQLSCMGCHQKPEYVPVSTAQDYVAPHLR